VKVDSLRDEVEEALSKMKAHDKTKKASASEVRGDGDEQPSGTSGVDDKQEKKTSHVEGEEQPGQSGSASSGGQKGWQPPPPPPPHQEDSSWTSSRQWSRGWGKSSWEYSRKWKGPYDKTDAQPPRIDCSTQTDITGNTLYSYLGLTPSATSESIAVAYRTLCKLCHPDKCSKANSDKAHELFKHLNNAYSTLKDKDLRLAYDAQCNFGQHETCPFGWVLVKSKSRNACYYMRLTDGHCQWADPRFGCVSGAV
jgi:hypothetical protein